MNTNSGPVPIIGVAEALTRVGSRIHESARAEEVVRPILEDVRTRGDLALREYARRFDGFDRDSFVVEASEMARYLDQTDPDLRRAIERSIAQIEAFSRLQLPREFLIELSPGVRTGQIVRPLETIAAYVPGGQYPLPSTVLMTCVPAVVAGVPNIWATTPKPNPVVLAAAKLAGATQVALLGGAHAIAAFAFGTDTIPAADRIVGPGNIYVTAAKKLLAGEVGIDFVAGPTEVVIVADDGDPAAIAADMIAQAEHDTNACSILVTMSESLAEAVNASLVSQLKELKTAPTALASLAANGAIVLCRTKDEAMDFVNRVAPEHLCLHDPSQLRCVTSAGSVFLGPWSPEAAGDYATGPNHVLPTGRASRVRGGLSVADFVKVITVQELTASGLASVRETATRIARAEGLEGHARSVESRGVAGAGQSPVSTLAPRPEVRAMRAYVPPTSGRENKLRLDFNESTAGPSAHVLEAIAQQIAPEKLSMYPDYDSTREALTSRLGLRAENLALTNGTDEAIQLVVNTFVNSGDEVVVLHPTYAMYRFYAELAGARIVEVPLQDRIVGDSREFVLDSEYIEAAIGARTRAIFLPNPNNPTGTLLDPTLIERVLAAAPHAAVLVDEAYFEFCGATVLPWIEKWPNLFVSRTMSKAHGLAGMRIGFLASCAPNIAAVRKAQSPYSVNALACAALTAATSDPGPALAVAEQAIAARNAIESWLTQRGIDWWKSSGNFVLFRAGDRCDALLEGCREAGILIRDRRSDIAGTLRVTATTRSEAERFIKTAEVIL